MISRLLALSASAFVSAGALAIDCAGKSVRIADLEEGQYLAEKADGVTYGIFKRRLSQADALRKRSDSINSTSGDTNRFPDWWPVAKMPPSNSLWASGTLRSAKPELFVFYALAPIRANEGACHVIHYPRHRRASFRQPNFYAELGPDWPGGFVDHCSGVGYDYSGRPVYAALSSGFPERERLSRFNLIVPEYRVSETGEELLVCR